jgi:FG-GAP-like repeat
MRLSRTLRLLVLSLASAAPVAAQQPMFAELHRMLPYKYTATGCLAVADVNDDGSLDLFIGGDQQDRLYLNDGTGFFTDATSQVPVSSHNFFGNLLTHTVAAGDVDGDGDTDLLRGYGSGTGWAPELLLNDGAGTFTTAAGHVPPADTQFVTFGDVDGDGDLDAVGVRSPGPFVYLNDGAGFFTDATGTNLPASLPAAGTVVALGDVDSDGDLDALYGRIGQNRLLLNTGSGSFVDATAQLPSIADTTFDLALADLDGDGDLDAVVGNKSHQGSLMVPSYVLLNSGSGLFTGPFFLSGALQHLTDVVVFDADLDLDLDVLLVGNGAQVYLNGASPVGPIALQSEGSVFGGAAAADLDGDGDRDVVIGNELHLNAQGAGLVQVKSINGPFSSSVWSLATADVDGDGDRDLVTNCGYASPRLYKNDGAGVLTDVTAQTVFPSGPPPFGGDPVHLADVDGDGDPDCFSGGLYLNNGIGLFFDASAFLPPNCLPVHALADVDGDGDLDAYTGQDNLLLNDGAAGFSYAATSLPQVAFDPDSPAAFGDFDGDGDQDLMILSSYCFHPPNYPTRLFLNGGAGTFIDASANVPNTWGIGDALAVGDVDGDGDLDAVITDTCTGPAVLLVNNGSGVFSLVPLPFFGGLSVALRDLDMDGDLDLVTGWWAEIWLNAGNGTFYAAPNLLPPQVGVPNDLALEDFDGDGDVDILVGSNYGPSQLLSNLTRQLSWRAPPRAGKPLTIDIVGPPNGAYLLIADTVNISVPLQPFGILRLDPATFTIVGSGSLDAQGRAAVHFGVPPTAPIGFTAYAQAAVAWPIHLTNPELFLISGL